MDRSRIDHLLIEARRLNAIAGVDDSCLPTGAPSSDGAPFVLVKDNVAVAGMQWTGGTPLLADVRATRDAAVVRLLREKGAIFPVRTTLHELAFGVTGGNGWTGAIGNPHDPSRMAGGSSGGSAAALALGLGDLSIVTDTGGSARLPAAFCGVIGFRPSTGRYPSDGMIALTPSRDTIGLMARELHWILWADGVLSGEALPEVSTARIGIAGADLLGEMEPEVAVAYRAMIGRLKDAGHRIVPVDLKPIAALDDACGFPIALYETYQSLLASVPALTGRSFDDLLAAVASPDVAHLLGLAASGAVTQAAYAEAIGKAWPALRNAYADLFAGGVDAQLLPTAPVTAPPIGSGEEVMLNGVPMPTFPTLTRFTRPDSMAGLPSISIPYATDSQGLPIGMMLTGARGADAALLAVARAIIPIIADPALQAATRPNVSYP